MTDGFRLNTVKPTVGADRLSLLLYGAPGAGKTFLAGTAEDDDRTAPVLFVDLEGGFQTISHRGSRLDVYEVREFGPDIRDLRAELSYQSEQGKLPYKTLVIDSLSAFCRLAMAAIVERPGRAQSDKSTYDDWNIFSDRMRDVLHEFTSLRCNVIMTALEEEGQNGRLQPLFPGKKVAYELPGHFNQVYHLETKSAPEGSAKPYVRTLLLQQDWKHMARDRADHLGTMPREMFDPTITKIMDRMEEGQRIALQASQQRETTLTTTQKGKN